MPAWFALATFHNTSYIAWRGVGLLGGVVAAGAWLFRELRRGVIRVAGTRASFRITEDRYPGAASFLRALHVRAATAS